MTFIVLYPSEIQKIFSVIDPYWTHERIRIFQWTFVFLMFALQLPNITIWLSIMWAALQGVIGPTLCIRTCYMVYKFTFQTIYPPNVKKQVMGQFYKCLQLLVPIVLFILSAVLIYIFQVGGVYKDQDSILGSMTQSFIIWSFCLYYRLFIECKRLVQLGLDIQSTHSDLKTDLSFQRTKAAPQSQEVL
ncbi:hypothetical protein EDD86DRAFT_247177 [Gorgonomyces haynaldii]|nr:hypothetical protein EDD86DRAFT_247177 [Gorgonomyces haynaldii]